MTSTFIDRLPQITYKSPINHLQIPYKNHLSESLPPSASSETSFRHVLTDAPTLRTRSRSSWHYLPGEAIEGSDGKSWGFLWKIVKIDTISTYYLLIILYILYCLYIIYYSIYYSILFYSFVKYVVRYLWKISINVAVWRKEESCHWKSTKKSNTQI